MCVIDYAYLDGAFFSTIALFLRIIFFFFKTTSGSWIDLTEVWLEIGTIFPSSAELMFF